MVDRMLKFARDEGGVTRIEYVLLAFIVTITAYVVFTNRYEIKYVGEELVKMLLTIR